MNRYLRITLRLFAREKLYTLLNVSGLALGLACCLVLGLYLWSELTYDRHHANHERIYRLVSNIKYGDGRSATLAISSTAMAPMLMEEYPDYFKGYVRFRDVSRPTPQMLRVEDHKAYWKHVYLADDNVFDVFTHQIVYGDPRTALKDPDSIAISRRMSEFYFGNENPVGRTITRADGESMAIKLVFEELPENSHLRYDALVAFKGTNVDLPKDHMERMQRLMNLNNFEFT